MAAVKRLLLETLNNLSHVEFSIFRMVSVKSCLVPPWRFRDRTSIADMMVEKCELQSVEVASWILMALNRTDLLQRLTDSSQALTEKVCVDEHGAAQLNTEAMMVADRKILLETLDGLNQTERIRFRWLMELTCFQKGLQHNPPLQRRYDVMAAVSLMMRRLGQQCVEVTREVFMDMNRMDLVQTLSETSSNETQWSSRLQRQTTMKMQQMKKLVEVFGALSDDELEEFKRIFWIGTIRVLPKPLTKEKELVELADEMMQRYDEEAVEETMMALKSVKREDLVQKLSDSSSVSEGASKHLEPEGCRDVKDSSGWTPLQPEVNAGQAPSYSLQSEAGRFECTVSGLRWVCKEKSSFRYQFVSWDGHMERMESMRYIPAGPLMDVTVLTGKFDEVYLPHCVCTDGISNLLDKFAVVHIDDCGDIVEKASEVTASHVKLTEPSFSLKAPLMRAGLPVKYKCDVLIYYEANKPFLQLHVFLIPRDPAIKQTVDSKKFSGGYALIPKHYPDMYLKMQKRFSLTADKDMAKIQPKKLTLTYNNQDPNFYEVFIKKPKEDFNLLLSYTDLKTDDQPWKCKIRENDYPTSGPNFVEARGATCFSSMSDVARALPEAAGVTPETEDGHFVDKHRLELIQRVSNVGPILDVLLKEKVVHQETYSAIRRLDTSEDQIRELYGGPLKAGKDCKDIFYSALQKNEPRLIADLSGKK